MADQSVAKVTHPNEETDVDTQEEDQKQEMDSCSDDAADCLDITTLTSAHAKQVYDEQHEPNIDFIRQCYQDGLPYCEGRLLVPTCAFRPTGMKTTYLIFTDVTCVTSARLLEILEIHFSKFTPSYTVQ